MTAGSTASITLFKKSNTDKIMYSFESFFL